MSECAFGLHAALAKKPEMLMYNTYTPLSELFACLRLACRRQIAPPPPWGGNPSSFILTHPLYSDTAPDRRAYGLKLIN